MSRSPFRDKRRRVLFEVWLADSKEFRIDYQLCGGCGFVCFFPRPSAADVDAKYRFLSRIYAEERSLRAARTPSAIQSSSKRKPGSKVGKQRSAQVFEFLKSYLGARKDLMDFGGGRGVMLSSFLSAGFNCGVVDYMTSSLPGMERLGSTLEDVPSGRQFDVVICSHVFEHLAEPFALARELRTFLRADGLLFVEVPLELVGGAPRRGDPVTHINFFCVSSLSVLLRRAGYEILFCDRVHSIFEDGQVREAVRAIAQVHNRPVSAELPTDAEARALLREGQTGQTGRTKFVRLIGRLARTGRAILRFGVRRGFGRGRRASR